MITTYMMIFLLVYILSKYSKRLGTFVWPPLSLGRAVKTFEVNTNTFLTL